MDGEYWSGAGGAMRLYTIGHGNHDIAKLIALLRANSVLTVVDVRTAPFSRYNPQFNKEELDAALSRRGIQYLFAGKYLGGRPSDPTCYKSGVFPAEGTDYLHEVDYAAVMTRDWFVKGIKRLLDLAERQPTATLCSEEDPARCHRHHLIAKYILAQDAEAQVCHIRGDGTVYSAATILKSVDKPAVTQHALF
jgi:uncharacterized protein (DUF488 family)